MMCSLSDVLSKGCDCTGQRFPPSHGSMRRMLINAKLIEMMKRYGRIEKMTSRKTKQKKRVGNFGE